MPTRKLSTSLRCFVAMAFDRGDTDSLYDKTIHKCLSKLSVLAVRIDRINHNGDVDDKIIEELNKCDFALADLTYARPSVYFEAGYAQRVVPVVYTARSDHFRYKKDDDHGNFRVHFDLQMRNIIQWKDPQDKKFAEKLSKRVMHVIQPLLRKKQQETKLQQERAEFASLSLHSKNEAIRKVVAEILPRHGLKSKDVEGSSYFPSASSQASRGVKIGKNIVCVEGRVSEDNAVISLREFFYRHAPKLPEELLQKRIPKSALISPYKQVEIHWPSVTQHIFLCSVGSIPRPRIMTAFSTFSHDSNSDCYRGETTARVHPGANLACVKVCVHVLDKIKSLPEFRADLQKRVRAIG